MMISASIPAGDLFCPYKIFVVIRKTSKPVADKTRPSDLAKSLKKMWKLEESMHSDVHVHIVVNVF